MNNEKLSFLQEKTAALTTSPGCYIMKNQQNEIIYIGKAKNLKNRVTSYFRDSADHTPKVAKMVSQVSDYDFIVTDSEFEALVLECSLIKMHKPKYNILLKDDKGYSYIKISKEDFPRITAELQKKSDGEFLGPFMSSYAVRNTVDEANTVFALPTCKKKFPQDFKKQRPCLNFYIKKCQGICRGNVTKNDYSQLISQAVDYMQNGSNACIERLKIAMENASETLNFELAASLRDRIYSIEKNVDKQKVVDIKTIPIDVMGIAKNTDYTAVSVIKYRDGKLFDKKDFIFSENNNYENFYEQFIIQYYSGEEQIPRELLIDEENSQVEIIEQYLREKSQRAVTVSTPKRGASHKLTELAKNNANEFLSLKVGRTGKEINALSDLANLLGMTKPPEYIECYDISNLASSSMVAGMVVFQNGRPLKSAYKKFAIKQADGQNDYACMQEIIRRRFNRYFEGEDEGFSRLPDLILLDGGKGHVSAITPILREMGIQVPCYGLVKDNKHRTRAIASSGSEISISGVKSAFFLLTRIQDEVHRFAITYQRKLHQKNAYNLELTQIKGIGVKKATNLITHFKTKDDLKKASVEELSKIAGVNISLAEDLKEFIKKNF